MSLLYPVHFAGFRGCGKSFLSSSCPKVCVVGGGPAGFYTTQHLLKVCFSSDRSLQGLHTGLSFIQTEQHLQNAFTFDCVLICQL